MRGGKPWMRCKEAMSALALAVTFLTAPKSNSTTSVHIVEKPHSLEYAKK